MTFQVEILPIAEKQIDQAYSWYRERNPEFADRMVSRIDECDRNSARETPTLSIGNRE
jgi:plasmid stabilization system protein ParE